MTFHSISEGRGTCQAAECYLKVQICLFFKWRKQSSFANTIFLSPGVVTKAKKLFNIKDVEPKL